VLNEALSKGEVIAVVRQIRVLSLILVSVAGFAWAQPQIVPAQTALPQPGNTTSITIGQSAARLYGPWKFTVGDSPLDPATHQPLWAEAGFDDSKWEDVDLTPKEGATDPTVGFSGYVPGWTMKGHPGYWGYAWYRIRVRLNAQPGEKLALAGPSDVDDAYQVFANGTVLGSFGDFTGSWPVVYDTQPMMFTLPTDIVKGAEKSKEGSVMQAPATVVLAFRFWMEPNTLINQPDVGGIHTAPLLGDAATVAGGYQSQWLDLIRAYAMSPIELAVFLLLALVAFSLTYFDRADRVYLWMGAVFLVWTVNAGLTTAVILTQFLGGEVINLVSDALILPLGYAGWAMVWWLWFGLRRPAWLPRATAVLTVLLAVSNALGGDYFFTVVSHPVSAAFHIVSLAVRLTFVAILLWIVYQGIRLRGVEGWLALPPVLLFGIARFTTELALLHILLYWFPFGVRVGLGDIAELLLAALLVLLLLRRLLVSLENQRRMALDVKQAQEVQQVILPPARMTLPRLEIESEYRPALEVGGDFFQIIPHPTDGSLLIVAGDVAGKGLRSGMLVALLVGAIRSTVDWSADPVVVLRALNNRLLGRGDAQATCLALRIDADGEATLVNAGHLPPYLNGEPLAMEGALPLGMLAGTVFSVMNFKLAEGDRLLLLSDGIAEARDADGRLFGFERVAQLLQSPPSAAELASAAQRFGQQDDISVISVTRTPVREAALA
jgi:hypothetical protein